MKKISKNNKKIDDNLSVFFWTPSPKPESCQVQCPNFKSFETGDKIFQFVTWARRGHVILRFWASYKSSANIHDTALKIKFSIKDLFTKCDQICSFLRIWSHLLQKSLMGNFIFCAAKFASPQLSHTFFHRLVLYFRD